MLKLDWQKCKQFFHESWHPKMQPIMESKEVAEIYERLKKDCQTKTIVPLSKDTFKSFMMPLDEIRIVWLLQDPYPNLYPNKLPHADGIAMSCSNSPDGKVQPSLEKFYDAISKEYEEEFEYNKSLQYLVDQGNMFLNTDLTCEARKTESHSQLWEPFMKKVFNDILFDLTGIIYVVCGKSSKRLLKWINPLGNYIFELSHPASAAYSQSEWDSEGVFKNCNRILKGNNGVEIIWNYDEYKKFCNVPII